MGRGSKVGIGLLVLLVVLLGLVVVADRVGAGMAEDRIAEQAATELRRNGASTAGRPEVEIGGFPFLTQVLGGTYEKITITADEAQSGDIRLDTMKIVATDVKAAASDLVNGSGPVTAGRLTGTATMSWDTVKQLIELSGVPSGFDPSVLQISVVDNRVELRLPLALAGLSTTLKATGEVSVAGGKVQLRLTDVVAEGTELPAAARRALDAYRDRLTATIRTPQMPYTLVINKVQSTEAGVLITASAADVELAA